jgi:hypothetical protein
MRTAGIALVAALAFAASMGADASCKGDARKLVRVSFVYREMRAEKVHPRALASILPGLSSLTLFFSPPPFFPAPFLPLLLLSQSGVCRDFINYFREHIDELGDNPTNAAIKAALDKAPIPSGECCTAVRPFIDAGCPCNKDVVSLASRANIKASTLRTLSRAVPVSACANPSYGPNVVDRCSASAFAQITATIAEEAAEDAAEAAAYAATLKAVAEAEKTVADSEAASAEPSWTSEQAATEEEEAPAASSTTDAEEAAPEEAEEKN